MRLSVPINHSAGKSFVLFSDHEHTYLYPVKNLLRYPPYSRAESATSTV